ncbi:hypothetical protein Ae406Ps2_6432c [Pseudonocardia sp. Ae406_Ps2]|nr:hypothetical protein Ae406Ps2_6432c [Pseudonocardia sp. Ae406_Ps2]OLM08713.1 hypothetical protein Ae706Ps2_6686c [Pseudonocardia sp. Ae706_Ps2]
MLDGQMGLVLVVLTCTSCQHAEEIPDDGGRLPEHCSRCDGWAFIGELISAPTSLAS